MRCNEQSDFKYIPNYAPSVIAEFNDNHLIIKDFNTKLGDLIENSFV